MRIRTQVGDGLDASDTWIGDWYTFLENNMAMELEELITIRDTLESGETYHGGGGAAPEFSITPLCDICGEEPVAGECDNCECHACGDCGHNYRTIHGETWQCRRCTEPATRIA